MIYANIIQLYYGLYYLYLLIIPKHTLKECQNYDL